MTSPKEILHERPADADDQEAMRQHTTDRQRMLEQPGRPGGLPDKVLALFGREATIEVCMTKRPDAA